MLYPGIYIYIAPHIWLGDKTASSSPYSRPVHTNVFTVYSLLIRYRIQRGTRQIQVAITITIISALKIYTMVVKFTLNNHTDTHILYYTIHIFGSVPPRVTTPPTVVHRHLRITRGRLINPQLHITLHFFEMTSKRATRSRQYINQELNTNVLTYPFLWRK